MKEYLLNLLPRIKRFSETLDKTEWLADQPWIFNSGEEYHQYIFKRDKKLIVSINGAAEIGAWEFISTANSLLVEIGAARYLFKPVFFDKSLLILQRAGTTEIPWVFANERLLQRDQVTKYLEHLESGNTDETAAAYESGQTKEEEQKGWAIVFGIIVILVFVSLLLANL